MNPKLQLMKVMIVDDETLAIEHLKSLLCWEDYGFTVVAEAVTANQAIDLAKAVNPQVIFMDIRMPHMDGLEISKRILSHNSRVKIVLFTSHRDFEYAKEAIKIGVSNYLIKHEMNAANLKEEMVKIKKELAILEQKELSVISQSLRELLEGGKPATNVLQELEQQVDETNGSFILLFVQADTPFPVIEMDFTMFHNGMPGAGLWRIQSVSEKLDYVDTIVLEKGKQAVLLAVKQTVGENLLWAFAHETALKMQMEARRNGLTVTVVISPAFKKLEKLSLLYRQMEKKTASVVLFGREQIWRDQDIQLTDTEHQGEQHAALKWNRNKHEILDEDTVMKRISTAFDLIKPDRFHPDLLKSICRELIHVLEQWREKKGMPSYTEMSLRKELDYNRWYMAEDIKQWFIFETKHIRAYSDPMAAYSKKVQLTIRYIEKHYQEDLTIESIGGALSISGDHLRHRFKEETGRTVTDFLTGYRMEKAKELLAINDYKVYEISEMVGYKTSQYFSQVFKKWSGVTPQEYRESVVKSR